MATGKGKAATVISFNFNTILLYDKMTVLCVNMTWQSLTRDIAPCLHVTSYDCDKFVFIIIIIFAYCIITVVVYRSNYNE